MNSNFLCKVYGVRGYRVTGKCHKDNKTRPHTDEIRRNNASSWK